MSDINSNNRALVDAYIQAGGKWPPEENAALDQARARVVEAAKLYRRVHDNYLEGFVCLATAHDQQDVLKEAVAALLALEGK